MRSAHADGGRFAHAAAGPGDVTDMDDAAQEGAGGQDDAGGPDRRPVAEGDAADAAGQLDEVDRLALDHLDGGDGGDFLLHGRTVQGAVRLRAGP